MTHRQGGVALSIAGGLWGIAWPFLAGLALGFFALRALQRRGLRWTWAFLGVPVAYLAWFVLWRAGLVLTVATLVALWHGARAHGEALALGGEEAREKREAPGPLRFAYHRLAERRTPSSRLRGATLALGRTRRAALCRVPFGIERGVHALILGATGSGKTVTQAAIAQAYVQAGLAAIVIDPKGDRELRETLRATAAGVGARFRVWSPDGDTVYNPIARGGVTEIADKALAAHQWSEPHYELATQRLLGHALATMRVAGLWPPSLSALVAHMDPERLDALASRAGGAIAERTHGYVDSLSGSARADLGGGRDRLAVLAESELGPCLDPELGEGEQIDLAAALGGGEVLYFHLDADRYPAASKLLAAALLTDLIALTAELQGAGAGGLLVIDEFAALAAEQVSRLFARARSAGLSLLLGTQSLADLRAARPDDPSDTLTEQVLSNVEFTVAHRIADPDSAERLARVAGTEPAWAVTQRIDATGLPLSGGEGTRTRQRDFLIAPDQLKRLGTGEAVVIDPRAKHKAEIVRIWPPHQRPADLDRGPR